MIMLERFKNNLNLKKSIHQVNIQIHFEKKIF